MGARNGNKSMQDVWLEGDTDSEQKVKKLLHSIEGPMLEAKSVHLPLFVGPVLAGIAEAVLEAARFGSQSPDKAFASGEGLGLEAEGLILEGQGGVDPLPTGSLEGGHHIRKNEGVEVVVVDEEGMTNVAAEDVNGELAVERGAVEQMRDEVIAIRIDACLGLLREAIDHSLVDIPIRSVDGDVADAVAVFLKECSEAVALVGGVAFLEERIAKKRSAFVIGSDNFFVFEKIYGEVGIGGGAAIVEVRIGMVADHVTGLVPGRDEPGAFGFVDTHATDEEGRLDVS